MNKQTVLSKLIIVVVALSAMGAIAQVPNAKCIANSAVSDPECWPGPYYSIAMAETTLDRYPDAWNYPWKRWCYPEGYLLMGIAKVWETTGEQKYFDYIMNWANYYVDQDGNLSHFRGDSLDDILPGCVLCWAYKQTGDERFKKAATKVRRAFDNYPRTADGLFEHNRKKNGEVWVDGVFMGQMFLTKYGAYVGDSAYCFDEAARQLLLQERRLKKGNTGLLLHAWDEDRNASWADPKTGLSPEVWSEGLGWYALVMVETLDVLPKTHPRRPELIKVAQNLANGLKNTQDPVSGCWFWIVDKGGQSGNWTDVSGSSMFTYFIQRMIELELVDKELYAPVVRKGYQGILAKARPSKHYGLVDLYDSADGVCVQQNYEVYVNQPKRVNSKEAVPGFLWATWIVEKPGKSTD